MYLQAEDIKYQLANLKQLVFEVTDDCNLQCKYCAYGELYNDYDDRNKQNLRVSIAKNTIDYLKEFWNSPYNMSAKSHMYISFYGGEPLLNMPFIKEVIRYIEDQDIPHRQFSFSMTTNAVLLERYMDYLVEKNFNLLISLDGNEYNSSYRVNKAGRNAFADISKNVESLRHKYPDFFEEKVNFNAVLHNRNSTQEIYAFFKENYGKLPAIGELNNMGVRPDKIELFQQTYRNSYESLHQAENYEAIEKDMFIKAGTYQTLTTFIHQHSGFVFHDYPDLLFGKPSKRVPTGTCTPFSRKMFITVNGKIMPCERIGQQFSLGSVTEAGVVLDLEAIAGRYNAYFAKLENQCSKCYKSNSCIQCIFNLPELDASPRCHGFMNRQGFDDYQKTQMDFLRQHPEDYYRIMQEVIVE